MNSKNVAMTIIDQLNAWGVKNIFGFIGDDIFYLMDALSRQNNINFYQVQHEESAALMASAYAKATGELGVCIADGGPGTLHLLNGLADAYMDGVPVLAITGQVSLKDIGTNAKQYLNQQLLLSSITSYSDLMADPKATTKILEKAYRSALKNKSVAHITVPMDILSMPCMDNPMPKIPYLTTPATSSQEVIKGALELMQKSEKPLILVGEGGHNAGDLITNLASKWGAGIITTLAGTGIIDNHHPLYVGGLGHAGSPLSTKLLEQADLCLILGANWWPQKYVPRNIPIIEVDIDPANLGATTQVSYGLVGNCNSVLKVLLEGIKTNGTNAWSKYVQEEISIWQSQLAQETKVSGSPIHPATIIKTLEKVLPSNSIVTLDSGDNTVWFGRVFRASLQKVLLSGKWRTMGFGLPAAIAAKINFPNQKVIALVGDGGLIMTMSEVLTAVRYNLPIIILVLNNGQLAMEKNKMVAGGLTPLGTALQNPDFAAFASSCGAIGISVKTANELEEALTTNLSASKPVLIDIKTDAVAVPGTTPPS